MRRRTELMFQVTTEKAKISGSGAGFPTSRPRRGAKRRPALAHRLQASRAESAAHHASGSSAGASKSTRAASPPLPRSRPSASSPTGFHSRFAPTSAAKAAAPSAEARASSSGSAARNDAGSPGVLRSAAVSGAGAAEAAVEVDAPDVEPAQRHVAEAHVELRLRIAPRVAFAPVLALAQADLAVERDAGVVERVAAPAAARKQQRGAGIGGEIAGVAGELRHQEHRRAVPVARHADQRRQRGAVVERRQRRRSRHAQQPFGVAQARRESSAMRRSLRTKFGPIVENPVNPSIFGVRTSRSSCAAARNKTSEKRQISAPMPRNDAPFSRLRAAERPMSGSPCRQSRWSTTTATS